MTDPAYRFCCHEPGVHVVLFGTGNKEHLAENVESLQRFQLPEEDLRRLKELFGSIDHFTGHW